MDLQGIPFTKVYRSILTSSVWTTPHPKLHMVRCVWMTLLFLADRRGVVLASVPGIATAAVVSIDDAEEALAYLRAPDKYSRTPDAEGRRLVEVPGGWRLLNYEKYRDIALAENAKESKRAWYYRNRDASKSGDPNLGLEPDWRSPSVSVADPDLDRSLAEQDPGEAFEATGAKPVFKNLDGWEPSEALIGEALAQGLTRAEFDHYLGQLRDGPIGGRRGTFNRDNYVRRLLPSWRTWAETARAAAVHPPGSTNGASRGPRRGGILRSVLEPTGRHLAYAKKHGLDIEAMIAELDPNIVEQVGNKRALEILGLRMSAAVRARKESP